MKKTNLLLAALILPVMLGTLISCQKEKDLISPNNSEQTISKKSATPETRAYHDNFSMKLHFVPDIAGGWVITDPDSYAWWPGDGDGNATHMGNASIYYNQYTVRQLSGVVHLFSSPVTMFFPTELQAYNVPPEVSVVAYDHKGNSIWFKNDPAGIPGKATSPTKVVFSGTMYIIGGTGKFFGATGEVILSGYFNPAPLQTNPDALLDGNLSHDGWIRY
ncbi:hypothetical protein QWZ08_07080 [Ferruginibacter paludis]|uniref:hypothetical protein n=1 Tax=Ferruginibacter paludis TaxID=1310417 RepID=UPI0025B361B9|nr:hypothetical protein [Ferruginibacter paludis]MDN3655380.1 hypothetical protein [Ferruginibacter paludis]